MFSHVSSGVGIWSNVANHPVPPRVIHPVDHVQVFYEAVPGVPPAFAGQGAVGQVRATADLGNGSPKRGWDGVLRVSQPSRTPDTSHANDTLAGTGHRHSPFQRAGGIFPTLSTASSSRTRYGSRSYLRQH
jgi:hypothetical protein